MIQVNLLPDIKQQFLKAKRLQRLVMTCSIIVAGASLAIFLILLISVNFIQKNQISSLTDKISKLSGELKAVPDIDRVLTVQAQLKQLPTLHAQKPVAQRLSGYIAQVTPTSVTISKLTIDFQANTLIIEGSADKLEVVNKYVDTLKFTNYKIDPSAKEVSAFKNVVLAKFGRDTKGATYQVTLSFDPAIFNSAYPKVALVVPKIVTTRSETQLPLFQKAEGAGEGN